MCFQDLQRVVTSWTTEPVLSQLPPTRLHSSSVPSSLLLLLFFSSCLLLFILMQLINCQKVPPAVAATAALCFSQFFPSVNGRHPKHLLNAASAGFLAALWHCHRSQRADPLAQHLLSSCCCCCCCSSARLPSRAAKSSVFPWKEALRKTNTAFGVGTCRRRKRKKRTERKEKSSAAVFVCLGGFGCHRSMRFSWLCAV